MSMFAVVMALCWATGVALAIHAIHEGRTSQGTLCWILLLLIVPPVAIPLYLMFGERRLEGYVRARRHGRRRLDELYRTTLDLLAPHRADPAEPDLRVLSGLAGFPWTAHNRAEIFKHADDMYDRLVASIDGARRSIVVQFFIYRDDSVGRRVRDALRAACQRGVRVYAMYDEIGCVHLSSAYFEALRECGGQVSGFRTVPKRRRMLRLNFRNHRKLVVVDGKEVYFGGMNVGEEYCGRDKAMGHWRDTHMWVEGPAALCAQLVFAEDWNWAQGALPEGLAWEPLRREAQQTAEAGGLMPGRAVERVLVYPSGPTDNRDAGVLMFLQLINHATKRLWIATPYFVCEDSILQAILLAKLRGVDVRILIPGRPDKWWVYLAGLSYVRDVVAQGVPVYSYAAGFTHQKVVLCDNVASVGSANLDHRSMRLNFELTGMIADADYASLVADMLERDMAGAPVVSKQWWTSLTSMERFKVRVARLGAPAL